MSIERDILFAGRKIMDEGIINESIEQGHYLTGNFARSFSATITESDRETVVASEALAYGFILSKGVSAAKVPYSGGSGAQFSQFIQGLIKYWQLRGLPPKEAERAAFATARKQSREGISTRASSQYSKTGKRQGFIEIGIKKAAPKANKAITQGFNREVQKVFNKTKSGTI